jgi:hypothetical protein
MLDPDPYPDPDSINPYSQLCVPVDLLERVELMNDGAGDDGDELIHLKYWIRIRILLIRIPSPAYLLTFLRASS